MATLNEVLTGMTILAKYSDPDDDVIDADHDIIYVSAKPPTELLTEDAETLDEMGWTWDHRQYVWQRFV